MDEFYLVSRQAHALRSHPLHDIFELLFLWADMIFAFAVKRLELFAVL
jgi:hypothetical protein